MVGIFVGWQLAGLLLVGGGMEYAVEKAGDKAEKKKKKADESEKSYEEMKKEHDEEIKAGENDAEKYTDPDAAADSIRDILRDRSDE